MLPPYFLSKNTSAGIKFNPYSAEECLLQTLHGARTKPAQLFGRRLHQRFCCFALLSDHNSGREGTRLWSGPCRPPAQRLVSRTNIATEIATGLQ